MQDFRWLKELWEGLRYLGQNTERLTALPVTGNLFTVAGGRILLTGILGEITAGCDANPTATRLTAVPTVGTTVNLCAATDIASYALGDLLGITGVPTDPLLPAVTSGSIPGMTMPVIVKAGTISMVVAVAGQVTGRVRWTLKWVPFDSTASVLPA